MAFFKGSSYEAVPAFQPDEEGRSVFAGVLPRPMPVAEPVLEHSVALKERLDSVAQHYYAQPRDWRRIADANPDVLFAEDLLYKPVPVEDDGAEKLGDVVLIPRRKDLR